MSLTAGIIAGVGAAGSIGGAAISSSAAGHAADTQANAATQAANIQAQSAREALQFQRDQFNTSQNNIAPWLQVGRGGLANLAYLMGIPMDGMTVPGTGTPGTAPRNIQVPIQNDPNGENADTAMSLSPNGTFNSNSPQAFTTSTIPGSPGTPATPMSSLVNPNIGAFGSLNFVPPTAATEQNDPGYQFRLDQGKKLLEGTAAARGNLYSGGTGKAEQQFGEDYASNEYQNVYNRALSSNTAQFNKFAALAGVGQTAANTLNSAGENFANNASTISLGSGNAQAQGINNAAAARASGYVGGANAFASGLGGLTNNISQLAILNSLYGGGGTTPTALPAWQQNLAAGQGYIP